MESISNSKLKKLLETHCKRDLYEYPDPLWIAKELNDEKGALVCALFAYGSAASIVKFLRSLDFGALEEEVHINAYYRFQKPRDVEELFKTLRRAVSLQEPFLDGYRKSGSVLEGLHSLISYLRSLNPYRSYGYDFLLGKPPQGSTSPYKRWNMFLRWMVRKEYPDLGLWEGVNPAHLIIPLDTHTFHTAKRLGLLQRKSYDLKAAIELTEALKKFDPNDPVRYDFALYRIGQLGLV